MENRSHPNVPHLHVFTFQCLRVTGFFIYLLLLFCFPKQICGQAGLRRLDNIIIYGKNISTIVCFENFHAFLVSVTAFLSNVYLHFVVMDPDIYGTLLILYMCVCV